MGSPRGRRSRALGALDAKRPAERVDAVGQAPQPGAPGLVRAAGAVVGDLHDRAPIGALHPDAHGRRAGVLGDVGQRLRHDEVGGRLDAVRQALVERDVQVQRQPGAVGELLERGAQAPLREDPGVDALGELAQLGERVGELAPRLLEQGLDGRGVALGAGVGEPERHRDGDEALLGPVVQVALDPPALHLRGLDDPDARGAELLQPGAQLGLQALVLEREPGRGARRGDQLGVVTERRVVHERGDPAPVALDLRHRPVLRERDRAALGVDVAVAERIDDGERRVA